MIRTTSVVYLFLFGFLGTQAETPSCKGVGEDEIVLFPNPANCSTFFQCTYEVLVEIACPAGLHFNDREKQCDYPNIAQCEVNPVRTFNSARKNNRCQGVGPNEIVLLPNPANCSTFFQCANEVQVEIVCSEGLQWNDRIKQCDYPDNAQCKEEINSFRKFKTFRIYNSCVGVPSSIDLILPNPDNCGTYIQCVHGQPIIRKCPENLHWSVTSNRCEWPTIANCTKNSCANVPDNENVLLPNPEDSGSYIQCVHQKPVVRPCPPGLQWSIEANRCDWPSSATYINSTISLGRKNYTNCSAVPINETVLLPNPKNCSTYIECTHQRPVVMPCPTGLHWNNATRQCDFPQNSQCRETNTTRNMQNKLNHNNCTAVPLGETLLLPNPNNCSTYIECVNHQPIIMPCPTGLHWNNSTKRCDYPKNAKCREVMPTRIPNRCQGIPSNVIVNLPNPANCSTYIQCDHGQETVLSCSKGLHWSVSANRCEWPANANCRRNSCEVVPETENVQLPIPEDCGSYIQCDHRKPIVRHCPSGLHWSVGTNKCEWPEIAKCNQINP